MLDLGGIALRVGGGEVDLVQAGDDFEVVLDSKEAVGQGLCLDPLRRVHDEHHPLASRQRAGHLVAEIDVTGRVDQVDDVTLPVDPHVLGLDGDAPLPLDVHRVEVLLAHVAGVDRPGQFQDPIRQRRLAVVDVSYHREITNLGDVGMGGGGHSAPILADMGPLPRTRPHRSAIGGRIRALSPTSGYLGGGAGGQC